MPTAKKKIVPNGTLIKPKKVNYFQLAILIGVLIIAGVVIKVVSHAGSCKDGTFGQGTSGRCVTDIQILMNAMYNNGGSVFYPYFGQYGGRVLTVDGQYGANTKADVAAFQHADNSWHHDTAFTVDGVVGPKTWNEICLYGYHNNLGAKADNAGYDAGCR